MSKSYQIGEDKTYCYPNTNILCNRLNIRDQIELQKAERDFTSNRLMEMKSNPVKGNFDFSHFQRIHQKLFEDLYDWAGQTRTVDLAKGNLFCKPEFIPAMADDIFHNLQKDNYLIGKSQDGMVEKLAYYFGELNALHPFREGNGRTQRTFLQNLSQVAGYELNFGSVTQQAMIEASKASFLLDYQPIEKIIRENIQPLSHEQHYTLSSHLVNPNEPAAATLQQYFHYIDNIKMKLKQAGYQPTEQLICDMKKVNQIFGRNHTVADIKQYFQNTKLSTKEKELVDTVGKDFQEQKKVQTQEQKNSRTISMQQGSEL